VKVIPAHWRVEALWCSFKGHVAPAAEVRELRQQDVQLGVELPDGSRLCRCLRCDDWVKFTDPRDPASDHVPPPDELPTPQRGRALEDTFVVRLIAINRGLHFLFFVLVTAAIIAIEWGFPQVREEAQILLQSARDIVEGARPGHSILVKGLEELSDLDTQRALSLLAVAIGYAALEGVEAVYLWKGKRWAEYLTVVATAGLLPLAIRALTEKVTVMRITGLILDLAILAYLVWNKRLFGVRGGTRGLEEFLAADTDWPTLHREAPSLPNPPPLRGRAKRKAA
jgi:uncharacterized membrane protein (DUF2068 family)